MPIPPMLNLHSLQTLQLSGAPSFAYPGTCLSGLHKKLGNLHMVNNFVHGSCIVAYIKRVTLCFVPPLMKTTAWLSKRLEIINQF